MKSLAERHADRAQRKADNAAFAAVGVGGNLGLAMVRIGEAQAAFAGLSEAERDELKSAFADGFESAGDETNVYDPTTGSLKMAGIGVVNPLIVPSNAQTGDNIGGGVADNGWGDLPEPVATPEQGNQNGVALDAQTGTESAPATARSGRSKAQAPASE